MAEKSLLCPIEADKLEKDKARALREAENFAEYVALPKKSALHLRLLAEELLGMTGVILNAPKSEFWIEQNQDFVELHLCASVKVSEAARDVLVEASSRKQNAAYKGMTGILRQIFDALTSEEALLAATPESSEFINGGLSMYRGTISAAQCREWSLRMAKEKERIDSWDELELSVLAHLADDIIASVRNDKAEVCVRLKI